MCKLHPLLRKQLQRCFGTELPHDDRWQSLFGVVDAAYEDFDFDRKLLERAIDLSSAELGQANSELRGILQALPDLLVRITAENRIVRLTQGASSDLQVPPGAGD